MKKRFKTITILVIIIMIITIFQSRVNATNILQQSQAFLEEGSKGTGMLSEGTRAQAKTVELLNKFFNLGIQTKSGFEALIDLLWSIGLLTIFVSTIILGIKYMLVLPEERSRIKQATTPYIMGVVIIFGALTIWRFIIVVLDGSLN